MTYVNKILLKTILLTLILVPFVYASSEQTATMGKTNVSLTEAWQILTTSSKASKWYLLTGADSVYMLSDTVMVIHTEQNETIALSLKKSDKKVNVGESWSWDDSKKGWVNNGSLIYDKSFWVGKFGVFPVFESSYSMPKTDESSRRENLDKARLNEEAGILDQAKIFYNFAGDKEAWLRIRTTQLNRCIYNEDWWGATQAAFDIGQEDMAKEHIKTFAEREVIMGRLSDAQWAYLLAGDVGKAIEIEEHFKE